MSIPGATVEQLASQQRIRRRADAILEQRARPLLLAIDPGNTDSGWCLVDATTRQPVAFGKHPNDEVLEHVEPHRRSITVATIEMVASYGMPVGRDVFETCVWIGRYQQQLLDDAVPVDLVYRRDVKLHHCHSGKANDANIAQALVDRFASGIPNRGKGTKAAPGWFYGFAGDVWQAYALAVYRADTLEPAATDTATGAAS